MKIMIINQNTGVSSGFQFKFRVKFYPPDPSKILQKEMTRLVDAS